MEPCRSRTAVSYTPIMAPDNRGTKAPRETTGARGRTPAARHLLARTQFPIGSNQAKNKSVFTVFFLLHS